MKKTTQPDDPHEPERQNSLAFVIRFAVLAAAAVAIVAFALKR